MSQSTRQLARVILPLKPKEARAAINAARDRVSNDLSDHYRILGAELRIDKPSDPAKAPARMVGVLIVDYGNRHNLEVLVDGTGKVSRVVDLHEAQPAFTRDEIEEARSIAEQDSRVDHFARMKGSFISEFGPPHSADNARRIGLRYARVHKGQVTRALAHAIIDLSTRKLVVFEESPTAPGREL